MARSLARGRGEAPFWADMIEKFIGNLVSAETRKAYLADLGQFLDWASRDGVADFRDMDLKRCIRYRDHVRAFGGRTVKGRLTEASAATVGRKMSSLSSFFEFVAREVMEETGVAPPNPFKRVERLRVDGSVTATEALVRDELDRLMVHVDALPPTLINLRDRALVKTLFGVVMRNRAFINLRGGDFYAVGSRFRLRYTDKGGASFDETLHPNTADAILRYLEGMRAEGHEVLDDEPLFCPIHNRKGGGVPVKKPFSVNQVTNVLRRHCRRAGVGDWVTSHSAKATVTSELVERYGVHMAQRKTKHKKTDQVTAYYGKRREREVSAFDGLDYITDGSGAGGSGAGGSGADDS